jgi:glycine betaine catabolism A
MEIKPRNVLPADAFTLPARYYLDAGVYAKELDRFFLSMWVCAGRSAELAQAGDYFLRELAGESIIILRDAMHELRAFYNVCRHRGTRLCTAPAGRFADRIQCPYHAWSYTLDGGLAAAPHMDDVPHFRKDGYPLHRVHAAEWDGHAFINLLDHPEPLDRQLAGLRAKFRPWMMGELRRSAALTYDVRANWKLIVQNYNECLHCPNLHPALNRLSHYLSGENEPLQPTYMGGRMDLREGAETLSTDGRTSRACLPGLDPADRRRVYFYALFPNLLLSLHPDYVMTHTLWPKAPGRTEILCEWHFHPSELARPDFSERDIVEFWDTTNRQDWWVCEQAQAGISSRAYRPGPYSNREDLLYAFDRFILGAERASEADPENSALETHNPGTRDAERAR